ncbi:polysaccharide lyase family 7 protein [Pseudomonas sp. EA_35y_Pfl2_R111]|uniref:polysaccharide lyase family 7 protein n=1 Tax=Pseudomonas sp. EA_35y_Pfl2_R111 TaxID=3088689 RepID=UPI0030DAA1A2
MFCASPSPRPLAGAGTWLASLSVLGLLCSSAQADLYSAVAPGGNFTLENWSLTVPADVNGGTDSDALTLQPHLLSGSSGYQSPWFYTSPDGAMTFWTPLNGATVGGSSSPRSELREMLLSGNGGVNWDIFSTSILDAQVRVLQVPSDGKAIIGQIHGHRAAPLVMVYYQYNQLTGTGEIIGKFQYYPALGPPYYKAVLASGIDLNERFYYQIKVTHDGDHGTVWASVNNGQPAHLDIPHDWDTERLYFKAGAYLHMHGDSASEGARVKFYRLATSHPRDSLLITGNAALAPAKVGSPYDVTLEYKGGVGGASWSLVSGFPPKGLVLDRDGHISGVADASAASTTPHDFMARVTDANGSTYSKKFSILVSP